MRRHHRKVLKASPFSPRGRRPKGAARRTSPGALKREGAGHGPGPSRCVMNGLKGRGPVDGSTPERRIITPFFRPHRSRDEAEGGTRKGGGRASPPAQRAVRAQPGAEAAGQCPGEIRNPRKRPERTREPGLRRLTEQLSQPFRPRPSCGLQPRASAFDLGPGLCSPGPMGRERSTSLR